MSDRQRADGIVIRTETPGAYMEQHARMRQDEFDTMLIAFKEAAGVADIEFDACGIACLRGLIEGMRYLYVHHGGDHNDSDKAMYRWFDKAGEWQKLRPLVASEEQP